MQTGKSTPETLNVKVLSPATVRMASSDSEKVRCQDEEIDLKVGINKIPVDILTFSTHHDQVSVNFIDVHTKELVFEQLINLECTAPT